MIFSRAARVAAASNAVRRLLSGQNATTVRFNIITCKEVEKKAEMVKMKVGKFLNGEKWSPKAKEGEGSNFCDEVRMKLECAKSKFKFFMYGERSEKDGGSSEGTDEENASRLDGAKEQKRGSKGYVTWENVYNMTIAEAVAEFGVKGVTTLIWASNMGMKKGSEEVFNTLTGLDSKYMMRNTDDTLLKVSLLVSRLQELKTGMDSRFESLEAKVDALLAQSNQISSPKPTTLPPHLSPNTSVPPPLPAATPDFDGSDGSDVGMDGGD